MPSQTEKFSIVYVIGAGASVPYGMPTGKDLKQNIIDLVESKRGIQILSTYNFQSHHREQFLQGFRSSPLYSIDAFLAARPQMTDLGKLLIAISLLKAEIYSTIDQRNHEGDWLAYLFNHLELNRFPERLSQIKFITFNYDRLVERFFDMAFQHTFGEPPSIKPNITRVHGSLGAYNRHSYEDLKNYPNIPDTIFHEAAQNIQIVHEGGECQEAKEAICATRKIVFLGLSYAPENIEKIWPNKKKNHPSSFTFLGSAFGMEDGEKQRIPMLPLHETRPERQFKTPYGNKDDDCLDILRKFDALPKLRA